MNLLIHILECISVIRFYTVKTVSMSNSHVRVLIESVVLSRSTGPHELLDADYIHIQVLEYQ